MNEEITFELPKEIKGKYMGKHLKILNLGDWEKTKIYIEGKLIRGLIQAVDINLHAGELARVTLHFYDLPIEKMRLK